MNPIAIIEVASSSREISIVEVRQGPVGPEGTAGDGTWNSLTGTADVVPFDTASDGPAAIGEMAWDVTEETVAVLLKNTTLVHLGEDVMYHVENVTGAQIAKGAAVAYAGTVGASGKLRVKLWNGSTDAPLLFMGIAPSNIPNNGTGYVTHFGKIRGVNTQAFTAGSIIYANPSGTGLTQTAPTQGTAIIAAVCVSSANNGTLIIRPERERVAATSATPNTLVMRDASNESTFSKILVGGSADAQSGIIRFFGDNAGATSVFRPISIDDNNYDIELPLASGTVALIGNPPTAHTHGNISNVGAIGSTASLPLITTTAGVITTGTFGTTAGTFTQGNDPRLSDARTPLAHTHVVSDIVSIASHHLIGRHAGSTGAGQAVDVGNGIEFQGSGIRRSALTGDISAAAGSNVTTLAATIAGGKTFSGQLQLTGQAATDASSAMTRGLSDERYLIPKTQHSFGTLAGVNTALGPLGFGRVDSAFAFVHADSNVPASCLPFFSNAGKSFQNVRIDHLTGTHPTAVLEVGVYLANDLGMPSDFIAKASFSLSSVGNKTISFASPLTITGLFWLVFRPSLGNVLFTSEGNGQTLSIRGYSNGQNSFASQQFGFGVNSAVGNFTGTLMPFRLANATLLPTSNILSQIGLAQTANSSYPSTIIF